MTRGVRCLAWLVGLVLGCGLVSAMTMARASADNPLTPGSRAWQIDLADRAQGEIVGRGGDGHGVDWQAVTLPDAWRLEQRSGTWTYRLRLPTCAGEQTGPCLDASADAAVWLPRAGHHVALWVNGMVVARLAEVDGWALDRGQRPILLGVPPSLLKAASSGQENDVRLVVSSSSMQAAGLSRVWVGTESSLYSRHVLRDIFLMGSAVTTLSTSLLLTLGAFWLAWRITAEAWLFSLVSGLWGLREALWLVGPRFMPWDLVAALIDITSGAALLVACMTLFRLLDERGPAWHRRLTMGTLAAVPVLLWWRMTHAGPTVDAWVFAWFMVAHLLGFCATLLTIVFVWRRPSWPRAWILAGCLGVTAIVTLENWHDKHSFDAMSFEHLRLAPFMTLSALFVTCVSIYVRVSAALAAEAHHKETMQREIEAQRQELEQLHARERERAQLQAITDERARIVRDMHDGLGSQLVGMLSAVESDGFTRDELLDELNEALSQLRLTIDSLEPIGDDLSSLLGQLRYRLDTRLRKAGFKVVWDVAPLPADGPLTASSVNHLQRLLYETFSNVIKHSGAASVWVHASHDESTGVNRIVVRDDGRGFEVGGTVGRGLGNLAHRAAQLGADLEVRSQPGQGTQVSLSWAACAA